MRFVSRVDQLLAEVKDPDSEFRQVHYESPYGAGARDPSFVLDVPFQSYLDAVR